MFNYNIGKINSTERQLNTVNISYYVSNQKLVQRQALVDRGANGGITGSDAQILKRTQRCVTLVRLNHHQEINLQSSFCPFQ